MANPPIDWSLLLSPFERLTIHAFDWRLKPGYQDSIHCWALDRNSKSVLVRYDDFPTMCWIRLPEIIEGCPFFWDSELVLKFVQRLGNMLNYSGSDHAPFSHWFQCRSTLRGYRKGKKFPMVRLCFRNADAMRHCGNVLKKPFWFTEAGARCMFTMHEAKISSITKMLAEQDLESSGWHFVAGRPVPIEERLSKATPEYYGLWKTITSVPEEDCEYWNTEPTLLSIDIECYSHKHRAMPNEHNAKDVAYMISAISQIYQRPETRKRYGIVMGECAHIPSDRLENCQVISVDAVTEVINGRTITHSGELMLVHALAQVADLVDPDLFIGYNIIGFDYRYLDARIKAQLEKWPNLSRMQKNETDIQHKTWQSSAFGEQHNALLISDGRISIDLMKLIKRGHKLSKYDLNTVSRKFLGKSKHDISAPEMFVIFENLRNATTEVVRLYRIYQAQPVIVTDVQWLFAYQMAQVALQKAKEDTAKVLEYCIQDSELVLDLFDILNVWTDLIQLSCINRVTSEELFNRGQQIRCYSQIYYAASLAEFVMDDIEMIFGTYIGGMVWSPIPDVYDDVICLDFASLYPSIIIALNLCWSTLVPIDEPGVPDEDCHIEEYDQWEPATGLKIKPMGEDDDLDFDREMDKEDGFTGKEGCPTEHEPDIAPEPQTKLTKKGEKLVLKHYRHRFYQKQKGLLPGVLEGLVFKRRVVRGKIPAIKEAAKCLEKHNTIQSILNRVLEDPQWHPGVIQEHKDTQTALVAAQATAGEITAAKKLLEASELLNVQHTTKVYEEYRQQLTDSLIKAQDKPSEKIVALAKFEQEIATGYQNADFDSLKSIYERLNTQQPARLVEIRKLNVTAISLGSRELAIKVSANSQYGFTGAQKGYYPCPEVAATTTNYGQKLFHQAAGYIKDTYNGKQVYGDTDSVMFQLPDQIKSSKDCHYWGQRLSQEISGIKPGEKDIGLLPGMADETGNIMPKGRAPKIYPQGRPGLFRDPLVMAFEKAMRIACFKKKKYAAYIIAKDGSFKLENILDSDGNIVGSRKMMMTKGIVLARRDNCRLVRLVYEKILPIVLDRGSLADAMDIVIDQLQLLYQRKVPLSDLAIIKELGGGYKKESNCMNIFSRNLIRQGITVTSGDRLEFVIVAGNQPLLGERMRLLDQMDEQSPEPIDVNYYVERALMNPINQLISVGFKMILDKMGDVPSIKRPRARKAINLRLPVTFVHQTQLYPQCTGGMTLEDIRKIIRANVAHYSSVETALQPSPIPMQPQPYYSTAPSYLTSSQSYPPARPYPTHPQITIVPSPLHSYHGPSPTLSSAPVMGSTQSLYFAHPAHSRPSLPILTKSNMVQPIFTIVNPQQFSGNVESALTLQ